MSAGVRRIAGAALTLLVAGALSACGGGDSDDSGGAGGKDATTVRLGYFPNLTHASAIVGVNEGLFQKELDAVGGKLDPKTFNAGPAEIEALFSGAIDIGYIGPSPTVNGYAKSKGEALRVIGGATSGGAGLVVKPEINSVEDLRGKKVATPQLGNTQDVALRFYLKEKGLKTTKEGGGDVNIQPQENADALTAFGSGAISGAWVPEPWLSRMVQAGGKLLVDEATLWPNGQFVTTNIIVRTKFLKEHPDVVKAVLKGQVAANKELNENPAQAQKTISDGIGKLTGKPLKLDVIQQAWKTLKFTNDPVAASLVTGAQHAVDLGLLDDVDLDGLYDLSILNEVLSAGGEQKVTEP